MHLEIFYKFGVMPHRKTLSQYYHLKPSGFVLCKAILQQSYLKIIYRTLISNREHVVAPCLRVLTEVNRFDYGSACGILYSAFDFTVKDITRNLEVRGGKVETTDDSRRPTVRTTFLRFITSFFQYGSSNIKNQILGLRTWVSPVFKYLRTDSPTAINEVLEALSKYIIEDKEIPRATKTAVFNEWVLGHIAGLYGRQERVTISKAGKEEEKPIAEIAHEFLMSICTTPGNGICFPSSGWYPPGLIEGEEKRRGSGPPKVHNRTLSSFISAIRPYADTLQQDLLLAIFKTCPELVASYFISDSSFSFDPKLTSTWVGYYGFLTAAIELPIPDHFGLAELSLAPPPTNVIIENVMPKALTKAVLTKCISHESSCNLIKFLTTRLLVVSFQKLRKVLSALDEASTSMVDSSTNWLRVRFEFVEEFCKRVPDMSTVFGLVKSPLGQGMLLKEATSRLLAGYYETLSEVAFAGNFDIALALGALFADKEGPESQAADEKGLKFLEMRHLLRVARDTPDIKWWHKPATMPFSPFVSILRVCCGSSSSFPLQQIKTLLHSFVAPSLLLQAETPVSPLEALLESLSAIAQPATFEAALVFLDESISRCIRTPFKYVDDYAELVPNVSGSQRQEQGTAAVSPLVMTIVEQFKFFIESNAPHEVKLGFSTWLARFMESCAILGENGHVLAALCNRLVELCGHDKASKGVFKSLRQDLEGGEGFQLVNRGSPEPTPKRDGEGIISGKKRSRDLFRSLRRLDIEAIEDLLRLYRDVGAEVSLLDIVVIFKAAF
ncbi:ribosome 60S biogenesis N-terminal-domain-containing protein [Tuber brumale]|nr:ribosome 60S biogenesis N-terminal-domain-containing protein [Tuber brumale]